MSALFREPPELGRFVGAAEGRLIFTAGSYDERLRRRGSPRLLDVTNGTVTRILQAGDEIVAVLTP